MTEGTLAHRYTFFLVLQSQPMLVPAVLRPEICIGINADPSIERAAPRTGDTAGSVLPPWSRGGG